MEEKNQQQVIWVGMEGTISAQAVESLNQVKMLVNPQHEVESKEEVRRPRTQEIESFCILESELHSFVRTTAKF